METQQIEFQEKCKEFWFRTRSLCQTALVDYLMDNLVEGFEKDDKDERYENQDIIEWWEVNDYLKEKLLSHGEVILENDYGTWWGRCRSGQGVYMDTVIEDIVKEIN